MEDRYWLEFKSDKQKLLIDFADIRIIKQVGNECRLFLYSNDKIVIVDESYRQVINKIKKLYASRYK
jgi:hypothetical protein